MGPKPLMSGPTKDFPNSKATLPTSKPTSLKPKLTSSPPRKLLPRLKSTSPKELKNSPLKRKIWPLKMPTTKPELNSMLSWLPSSTVTSKPHKTSLTTSTKPSTNSEEEIEGDLFNDHA